MNRSRVAHLLIGTRPSGESGGATAVPHVLLNLALPLLVLPLVPLVSR